MTATIKESLEQINEVSRQLLSRILTVKNSIQQNKDVLTSNDAQIIDSELVELMSKRQKLIYALFEQNPTENISQESDLLNEVFSLNTALTSKSQACKQDLAEQMIKLKKSKKIKKSYLQY